MSAVLKFFAITYAVSWACFLAAPALPRFRVALLLLGTFAPSLVAIGLTAFEKGKPGLKALLGRVLQGQVGGRWYLFAIGYMGAIKLAAALAYRIIMGAWPRLGNAAWYIIAVAIVFSTPVQAGEEIGWRGYALPRLAARLGMGGASVLLGVVWAVWHLPIFYVPAADNYGQSFPVFMLGVIPLSVAMAWLYVHTKGSLLLVMLMHSAVNQTVGIVPSAVPNASNPMAFSPSLIAWLTDELLWIVAGYFLVRMRQIGWPALATSYDD